MPSPRRPEKPDAPRSPSDIAAACLAVQAERGWVYGEPRAENMRFRFHRSRLAALNCTGLFLAWHSLPVVHWVRLVRAPVASCSPDSTRAVVDRRVMRLRQTPGILLRCPAFRSWTFHIRCQGYCSSTVLLEHGFVFVLKHRSQSRTGF